MAADDSADTLSFQDTVFLGIERPHMPLYIGAVSIFNGEIPLNHLRRHIRSRLGAIPRYTQKVEYPPLQLAHPRWVTDGQFDIRHHVRELRLTNATTAELQRAAGQIFSQPTDRSRPLWDVTVVNGLKHGKTSVIWRVHGELLNWPKLWRFAMHRLRSRNIFDRFTIPATRLAPSRSLSP
jgi:hypothetical protein